MALPPVSLLFPVKRMLRQWNWNRALNVTLFNLTFNLLVLVICISICVFMYK